VNLRTTCHIDLNGDSKIHASLLSLGTKVRLELVLIFLGTVLEWSVEELKEVSTACFNSINADHSVPSESNGIEY